MKSMGGGTISTVDPEHLTLTPRQSAILELVRKKGFASLEAMRESFDVSTQTIRRDVIFLSKQNLLERYHGGAGIPAGRDRLSYTNRQVRLSDEKQRIGEAVARRIPAGASLFIDIGTTMEAVARALVHHQGLTVITNHMSVASILSDNTDFDVILTGGMIRKRDRALTGEATSEFLQKFRVGYAVFGIGAIDSDGQMLDYDYREVHVSQAAMAISKRKFAAADHSKFHGEAMMRFAHVSEIDAFFTNAPPPSDIAAQINSNNVDLHVAEAVDAQ